MKICCIYTIWNNITNESYVGSTIDFDQRIKIHFRKLRRKEHHSWKLQKAFCKYEESDFEYFILKYSNSSNLIEDEQWCLDVIRPEYNIAKIAGNTLGVKWSEERRIKQLKYLSHKPQSHIDKLKASLKANTKFIKDVKDRCIIMCENNKKPILVLDLNDVILFEFNSIIEAGVYLDIHVNNIQSRLSGRVKSPFQNKYKFRYK